ncbi:MAG: EFR1 family ferrodoxin [Oscillospiraceae bacterium]|jgi:ferredoxin|nr:EFR1 family ferrodoxin [Oscillospiraceae bacterium]
MTIFYFTATGNSLAAAKAIGKGVENAKLISIPQIINQPDLSYQDDVIGLVYPIYGFGLPKMVRRFLENVSWEADYTFAVGTYGNEAGAAARNVQRLAQTLGLRLDCSTTLLMVDNYLPGYEMGKQIATLPQKHVEEHLAQIIAGVRARKANQASANLVRRAMTAVIKGGEPLAMRGAQAQGYLVSESCTQCGACAKICPAGNISVGESVRFGDRCEWCLGCVHLCPQNAIHLKNERSAARWRNPEVTLSEIIAANRQT